MPYKDPVVAAEKARVRTLANYYNKRDDPEYKARRRAYAAKYRANNPEKLKAYREKTKEIARARSRQWHEQNGQRPDVLERRRKYREAYNARPEVKAAQKAYRDATKQEMHRYHYEWRLQRDYCLELEDVARLAESQNHQCAICQDRLKWSDLDDEQFHVDHCHTTGKVRGLLCESCNLTVGKLRDRADLAIRLAEYLTK